MDETFELEAGLPAFHVAARAFDRLSDPELLLLVRRREVGALAVAYDRHVDAVWRVACALAEDVEAAQDAVVAAFLSLWRDPASPAGLPLPALLLARVAREARPV